MAEVPNVRDGGARFKRILIAWLVGIAVSVAAWFITNQIVEPAPLAEGQKFHLGANFYVAAIAGAVALSATLIALNYRARKRAIEARQLTTP